MPTILVVDDEPLILQAIADVLDDHYRVLTAESGDAGLRILAAHSAISVILCDQRMPRMAGGEFFRLARSLSAATRVLVTGYADLSAVIQAVNEGQIYSYVAKPFQIEQLRLVINAAHQAYETATALQAERELLHGLMDSMPDFIAFKDRDGRFLRVNKALADHLGFDDPALAVGKREDYFVPADQAVELVDAERRLLEEQVPVVHQVTRQADEDGTERWWSTVTVPILNADSTIKATVSIRRDISEERNFERRLAETETRQAELEEVNRRISHAAVHDPLTGLPNRILLEDRMRQLQAQSKRRGTAVAFLYIDLDGFKAVNDNLGHAAGDAVLKRVAEVIAPCLRETDIAARLGGDEFAVIGEVDAEFPHEGAKMVADRILRSINSGIVVDDPRLKVGCSIGVAVFPNDNPEFFTVMRLADRAMYRAKNRGKNTVVLSTELDIP